MHLVADRIVGILSLVVASGGRAGARARCRLTLFCCAAFCAAAVQKYSCREGVDPTIRSCRKAGWNDEANPKRNFGDDYCNDGTAATAAANGDIATQDALNACASWSSGGGGFKPSPILCDGTEGANCITFYKGCEDCNTPAFNKDTYAPWNAEKAQAFCMSWGSNSGKPAASVFSANHC